MSTKLTFDITELRSIIEHARAAKEFSAPYGGKPAPALFFVKDSGIYLMSAGKPRQLREDGTDWSVVAYAKGYEADAPDSWDKCRAAVGGDDFAEALPLDWFTGALDRGATKLHLHVGAKAIRCTSTVPAKTKVQS